MTAINQYPNLCTSFEIINPPLLIPTHNRKKLKVEGDSVNGSQPEDYSDEEKLDLEPKDSPQDVILTRKENHKTDRKSYIKLSKEDCEKLLQNFAKNNYPTTEEMKSIARGLGVSLLKIENWYKHHRRSLAKKGNFDIKTKKHFNVYELNYLNQQFAKNQRPEREEITEISVQINCTELQVKNWFLNKRKKVKSSQETSGKDSSESKLTLSPVSFSKLTGDRVKSSQETSGKDSSESKLTLSPVSFEKEPEMNFGDAFDPSTQMKILLSIQQANSLKNIPLLNQTKRIELEDLQIPKLQLNNEYSVSQPQLQPNIIYQILESQKNKNLMALNSIRPEIPVLNENYLRLLQAAKQNSAYNNSQYPYNNHINFFGFPSNVIVPKMGSLRNQQQTTSSNYGFSLNQNFQRKIHFS